MITFTIALLLLIGGYVVYGAYVNRVFGPDNRKTPALTMADGVDYIPLPTWKIFMIQFLNSAGLGPIFGAIMGAQFGTASYLWIVVGTIFAGAVHDFFSGALSIRQGGESLPEIVGRYLGMTTKKIMTVFTMILMILVGAVFVSGPAELIAGMTPGWMDAYFWIVVIFLYYVLATLMPVDKIIGKIYPLFAIALLFMAVGILVMLYVKSPELPEMWNGFGTKYESNPIFPMMFISIACGAISGFHATQSPLMARCMTHEKHCRPIFYGAMIAEGIVAAPITSGDTALRSARLIAADFLHIDQRPIAKRLLICIPLFLLTIGVLVYSLSDAEGFKIIWRYFAWCNQTLSVFTLWAITVYLVREKKNYYITLLPALLMTLVCSTYICIAPEGLSLPQPIAYVIGGTCALVAVVWFITWFKKETQKRL